MAIMCSVTVRDLIELAQMFPNTQIVRISWRGERSHRALELVRRRVNREVKAAKENFGGIVIEYPEILELYEELFLDDEVHLTKFGYDIFMFRLQRALQMIS